MARPIFLKQLDWVGLFAEIGHAVFGVGVAGAHQHLDPS